MDPISPSSTLWCWCWVLQGAGKVVWVRRGPGQARERSEPERSEASLPLSQCTPDQLHWTCIAVAESFHKWWLSKGRGHSLRGMVRKVSTSMLYPVAAQLLTVLVRRRGAIGSASFASVAPCCASARDGGKPCCTETWAGFLP